MAKATELIYTEGEIAAIKALEANRGNKLSAKELGVSTIVLSSLIKKGNDERPMAEGFTKVVVNKEDYSDVCPTCGKPVQHKLYWID